MDYELIVIGGGGFIGLEFGFALAWAGTKVTVLQSGAQIAPALDDEIRAILLEAAAQAGIKIHTNAVAIGGGLKKSDVGAMHFVFPTFGGAIFDTMAI